MDYEIICETLVSLLLQLLMSAINLVPAYWQTLSTKTV